MVSCEFIIESESYLLVIKHGLLENPPFSWMIFPLQCPFYRGFPRSPTPFLDVLRQLPGRKAVAAAILFRCAGHAGRHVVLPTGRSQRVPTGRSQRGAPNQRVPQIFWCWGGSSTPKKSRDVWWDYSQKKTEQIYQKCVVVAQKSKIGLGLKFDPHSPHSSRPGCARLVISSLVKRPMLCSCNHWVFVCLWNLQTSSCNHGQTSRCTFRYSSSISWWNIK